VKIMSGLRCTVLCSSKLVVSGIRKFLCVED